MSASNGAGLPPDMSRREVLGVLGGGAIQSQRGGPWTGEGPPPARSAQEPRHYAPLTLRYGLGVSGVSYANAAKVRSQFSGRLNRVLESVDLMVCPSMSNAARPRLADPFAPDTGEAWASLVLNDIHTKPFNFSGSPTLSVPCGFSPTGLPFSVQFVGRSLSEGVLCRVGHAYEQATRWHSMHPKV